MSEDGRSGLTIIAFVGSVFSPYYAWARRRGAANPEDHCAVNVALYGPDRKRWSLTERDAGALARSPAELAIGPSTMRWRGHWLEIDVAEVTVPVPGYLRGRIRLHPAALHDTPYALDAAGRHYWRPAAPCARVEVDMRRPRLHWRGDGYFDMNWGSEPLEQGFRRWDWSRAALANGRSAVLYDREGPAGETSALGLCFSPGGGVEPFVPPPRVALPATRIWRISRASQVEPDGAVGVLKTLEDTPFYARSLIRTRLLGETVRAVHESVSLERFRRTWVQALLPFRMPRVRRAQR
ncbi:MAG: carotenoid 1,2-hydratase [Gammaproteobacteria bacterium]